MDTEQPELCRALVREAKARSSAAWGKLYDAYAPLLYRNILLPRLGSSSSAEDILAETFQTAIEKIELYSEEKGAFYSWLATIARNKAVDYHRHRARSLRGMAGLGGEQESQPMSGDDPEERLLAASREAEDNLRLAEVLTRLHERYRTALELRFLQGHSREACARRLEVKLATFDVVLLRALRAFRKEWDGIIEAPEVKHG